MKIKILGKRYFSKVSWVEYVKDFIIVFITGMSIVYSSYSLITFIF